MTIQQAIEKAIEGGYNPSFTGDLFWYIGYDSGKYRVFLDPLFWQSLGKAMGWNEVDKYGNHREHFIGLYSRRGTGERQWEREPKFEEWLYRWHRFIDHLAEGKDAESFF